MKQVEKAAKHSDARVRQAALHVLGAHSGGERILTVAALIKDPDEAVRRSAVEAIADMCTHGGDYRAVASEVLVAAVSDNSSSVRELALYAIAECEYVARDATGPIRACLTDEAPSVQIAATYALGRVGRDEGLELKTVALLNKYARSGRDSSLSRLLDTVNDPHSVDAISQLTGSEDASAKFRALCAIDRLRPADGELTEARRCEEVWSQEYRSAKRALSRATRTVVARSDLLAQVHESPLVLYGEMHEAGGPLREAQREIVRAFVKDPKNEAIGFEPSVEDVQRSVLDLARELGMQLVPLERDWRTLVAQDRSGARDREAVDAIAAFLGGGTGRRMIVLRGEDHVIPDGFLVRRVAQKPLVILSGVHAWTSVCDVGLQCNGAVVKVQGEWLCYVVSYQDKYSAKDAKLIMDSVSQR